MSEQNYRVLSALELKEADRVPVLDLMGEYSIINSILNKKPAPLGKLLNNKFTSKIMDSVLPVINKSSIISDRLMEKLNQAEMKNFTNNAALAAIKMGYDAVWISHLPIFILRDSRTMHDVFGREYDIVTNKKGYLGLPMYRRGLINGPEDWQALDKEKILRILNGAGDALASVKKKYGDKLFIFGLVTPGLFEPTWQSMGFESFVLATRKEKALLREMTEFYEGLYCRGLDILYQAGIPGAVLPDDLAFRSGPMLNPKHFDKLLGDSYRRIVEKAHGLGIKIMFHSCGNVSSLLEWIADCGFDAIHPLEPTADMELGHVKKIIGDRMCLVGNMDVSHILVEADKEEVFEAVRKAVIDAGGGGGFILAPAQNHESVSVERLRWMVQAAKQYGHILKKS